MDRIHVCLEGCHTVFLPILLVRSPFHPFLGVDISAPSIQPTLPPSQNSIFFRNISIKIKKWTKGQWKVGRVKDEGSSLSEILKLRGRESERCPQLCSAGREIQTLQGEWKWEGGESEELTFFEILQSFHQLPQLNFIITTAWNSRTARD